MLNLYIKAIHIIFVTTWFAGLFYIVRLFIYHVEAEQRGESDKKTLQDQYKIMERRLWNIITAPSMVLTVGTGLWLTYSYNYWMASWMQVKLGLIVGLLVYHFLCLKILRQLKNNIITYTSGQLRMWNEVATLFLVAIVFIIVVKTGLSILYGTIGLILLSVIMLIAIKLYKRFREKSTEL